MAVSSSPHHRNDKKSRRRRRNGREEEEEAEGGKRNECVGRRRRPPPTDRLSPLVARGTWSPDGTAPTGWRQSKRKKKKGKNWQAVVGRKRARRNWAEAAPTVRAFDRSARLHQTSFMRPSSSHTYTREYAGATLSRRCSFLLLRVRLQINKRPKRLAGEKAFGLRDCSRRAMLNVATTNNNN